MGAKLVAGIVGLIILVVLVQTYVLGGGDSTPSVNRPGSIPTATPPANQGEPVVLGQGETPSSSGSQNADSRGDLRFHLHCPVRRYARRHRGSLQGVAADQQAAWICRRPAPQRHAGRASTAGRPGSQAAGFFRLDQRLGHATHLSYGAPVGDGNLRDAPAFGHGHDSNGDTPRRRRRAGTYTVVSGDTPFLIAEKHCVDDPAPWVDELLDINNVEASALAIGMILDLPPGTPALCSDAERDGHAEP